MKSLSYTRKNKLLLPLAGAGLLLSWLFAFSKTFEAIGIHQELTRQVAVSQDLSFNPVYSEKKLAALKEILKNYKVNPSGWSNELWMKASTLALKQQVDIDYTLTKPALEKDTLTVGVFETLYCYGHFIPMVKLIDTLEHSTGIGKISALQIKAPKEDTKGNRAGQSVLKLEFRGIAEQ